MKSGFDTLQRVFRAITESNSVSRREISESLRLSLVSVSKAVKVLTEAGIISSDGSVSTGGRRSEFLCPSYDRKYLVINLCEKPFSYAYAHLGEELLTRGSLMPNVHYIPYLDDLDFGGNATVLARSISESIGDPPAAIAIAVPESYDSESGRLHGKDLDDYMGDDIGEIFARFNLKADVVSERRNAISSSPILRTTEKPCIYANIDKKVYGMYIDEGVACEFDWSGVRLDGLSISDILCCALDDMTLAEKLERFLVFAADIFNAKSVLLDTDLLSEDTVDELCQRIHILRDVTYSAPILSGLLSMLADGEIRKLPSAHFDAKK